MLRSNKFANPFYGLLLAAGIAFAQTATAYGVMAFRDRDAKLGEVAAPAAANEHPLMQWMNEHGETALMCELGILAACTFAAIGTDSFWQRRANLK